MGPEPGMQMVQFFEDINWVSWFLGEDSKLSDIREEVFTSCSATYKSSILWGLLYSMFNRLRKCKAPVFVKE